MSLAADYVGEYRRAYQELGVPFSASAAAIKRAYRDLAKKWHPDLLPAGTPDQSDANRKMKEINEAYGLIQYAPLRYHAESYPAPGRITPSWTSGPREPIRDAPPSTGAFEYAVRFVFGALLGGLFALRIWLRPSLGWHVGGATVAVLALAFGLAAARFGDDFWRGVLGRWWMWR